MAISFQNLDIDYQLKQQVKLKTWIKRVCALEKRKTGDLNFIFMNDSELLKYNIQYLHHDTLTDIISFDYSTGKNISGDIMISLERVKENAVKFKTDLDTELRRVVIHGVLHLCGYSDKTKKAAAEMRAKEDWALKKF